MPSPFLPLRLLLLLLLLLMHLLLWLLRLLNIPRAYVYHTRQDGQAGDDANRAVNK